MSGYDRVTRYYGPKTFPRWQFHTYASGTLSWKTANTKWGAKRLLRKTKRAAVRARSSA